jgi:ABC-type glycerol-3-phosphate transport system substrate-binding protein
MLFSDLHARIGQVGAICVIVCLLALSSLGCNAAAPTPEPITISFLPPVFGQEYYEALVKEFNKEYPYITVEFVSPGTDDADVFVSSPFALRELLAQDSIVSLDLFIEQDASFDLTDFYPGTVGLFSAEGKTWAIPSGVTVAAMFYNRDLFDQYNVPYPEIGWTWDDFLDRALALRDPGADVFGYAPMDRVLDPLAFIYQHGGRIFDDLQAPTRTTFDDPLTIEALEWYARLFHEHNVAPTPKQVSGQPFGGSARGGVYLNKVGMWIAWLAERGGGGGAQTDWPGEWKMRWGVVPLPRDTHLVAPTFAQGYFISSQAANPDACWQWVSFLSAQIPFGLTPARKSLTEADAYEQQVGSDVAAVARASLESTMMFSPRLLEFGGALGNLGRALDAIVDGRSTPEEAMIQAQRQSIQ